MIELLAKYALATRDKNRQAAKQYSQIKDYTGNFVPPQAKGGRLGQAAMGAMADPQGWSWKGMAQNAAPELYNSGQFDPQGTMGRMKPAMWGDQGMFKKLFGGVDNGTR